MYLIWIFICFKVKNSYLICVLLKKSSFFFGNFLEYFTHFCTISLKNTKNKLKIGIFFLISQSKMTQKE